MATDERVDLDGDDLGRIQIAVHRALEYLNRQPHRQETSDLRQELEASEQLISQAFEENRLR